MDLWVREARLFKYGSGTGTNFSNLRAASEPLSGGGQSSGLMSFLKIGDRAAGAIKSGGTTRRAAKMVCSIWTIPTSIDFIDVESGRGAEGCRDGRRFPRHPRPAQAISSRPPLVSSGTNGDSVFETDPKKNTNLKLRPSVRAPSGRVRRHISRRFSNWPNRASRKSSLSSSTPTGTAKPT